MTDNDRRELALQRAKHWPATMTRNPYLTKTERQAPQGQSRMTP
jgi:hypothetical protein